ncbi:hypothetical protein JCM11251_001170 [Rhodosporidiobolus azoricus]
MGLFRHSTKSSKTGTSESSSISPAPASSADSKSLRTPDAETQQPAAQNGEVHPDPTTSDASSPPPQASVATQTASTSSASSYSTSTANLSSLRSRSVSSADVGRRLEKVAISEDVDSDASSDSEEFADAAEATAEAVEAAADAGPVSSSRHAPSSAAPAATPSTIPPSYSAEQATGKSGASPLKLRERGKLSKAASLAQEKMGEDVPLPPKLDKPTSAVTMQDATLTEEELRADIASIWKALHLFLSSRITEAENICLAGANYRLYFSLGFALIRTIQSLATFEPEDLEAAIQCCRDASHIAHLLRKKDHGLFERVGSLAKGSTSVHNVKAMTLVQRHAELVYAECTLLKAVLGIIYSGDFLAFLKEALNMRNAYAIYRTLAKYAEEADEVDQDFLSGVRLGNGMISLILSLLPSTVLKIMDVFGFTGDREYALNTLMAAGAWKAGVEQPLLEPEEEGIRRPIADMVLLLHHLVIASYLPVGGVDIKTAGNILRYELDRYPDGIFFLYFSGRLHSTETSLDEATESFHAAIEAQREYVQLGHICYWDLGLVSLAQGEWQKGYTCFELLNRESNWSKAVYAYAKAITLYESGQSPDEVRSSMLRVPDLLQKIGGKSIPIEKFISRRARKFIAQGDRLTLPGIELAYVLNCLGLSPRRILVDKHLVEVKKVLADLGAVADSSAYGKTGEEYWDDYCLAHFLRGVILRFTAHPEPYVKLESDAPSIPVAEADEQALSSFSFILQHGRDIATDHHLVWFAHYELGRLYHSQGLWSRAREQYEQVMSGKGMELSRKGGKGKVSLQNMAVLRSNAGLQLLKEEGH